jgi:hypothetical protein
MHLGKEQPIADAPIALPGEDEVASVPPAQGRSAASRLELIDRIATAYGVDRVRATEGADLYLRQLHRAGLLAGH